MKKKNILVLCPDEMKATALGLYGQRLPVSPYLDQLAKDSVVFEQCHTVHPKCTPSRVSFASGQYPHVGGHRTLDQMLRNHEKNLIRTLKDNGYQTVLVGKNHTVDEETMPLTFDFHLKGRGKLSMEMAEEKEKKNEIPRESYWVGEGEVPLESFGDYQNTTKAIEWLNENSNSEAPFFMWVNWNAPHPPYTVPAPYYGQLDRDDIDLPPRDDFSSKASYQKELFEFYQMDQMSDQNWREVIATYLEMCRFIDDQIKRMIQALREAGVYEETMVVIWSDHGDFAGEHQLPEKWDTSFYDCITHIPFILHAPDRFSKKRVGGLVESIDIMPTLLDLVNVEIPKGIQGQSLVPMIKGDVEEVREMVFCQGGQEAEMFDRVVPPNARPRPCFAYQKKQEAFYNNPMINVRTKMIRDHRWKYIYHYDEFEELYDLELDPYEVVNLAKKSDHRDQLEKYRLKMIRKLIEVETVEPHQDYVES